MLPSTAKRRGIEQTNPADSCATSPENPTSIWEPFLAGALSFLSIIDLCQCCRSSRQFSTITNLVLQNTHKIELRHIPYIDDAGIISILRRCPKLQHADVSCKRLGPKGLNALCRAAVRQHSRSRVPLDRLLLTDGFHFEPADLDVLLEGSELRLLSLLNFTTYWTASHMEHFFDAHHQLTGITLYNCFSNLSRWSALSGIPGRRGQGQRAWLEELSLSPLTAASLLALVPRLGAPPPPPSPPGGHRLGPGPANPGGGGGGGGGGAAPRASPYGGLLSLTCFLEDALTDALCSALAARLAPTLRELVLRDAAAPPRRGEREGEVGGPGGGGGGDLSDDGLQALARCSKLTTLKLIRTKGMFTKSSDLGVVYLVMQCRLLQTLVLHGFPKVSDTAVSGIFKLKQIENLHLQGCRNVSGWAFYPSFSSQKSCCIPACLKSLNLSQCREIGSEAFFHVVKQCKNLEELNVTACSVDDSLLPYLRLLPKLHSLVLMSCSVSDAGITAFVEGSLQPNEVWSKEDLSERWGTAHQEGRAAAPLWTREEEDGGKEGGASACPAVQAPPPPPPRLQRLSLRGCWKVTDAGARALLRGGPALLGALEALDLTGLSRLGDDAAVGLAAACPRLRSLKLRDCPRLTDGAIENLQFLACSKVLRVLDISKCSQMSSKVMLFIYKPNFPRLCSLSLEGFPAKKRDVEALISNRGYIDVQSLHTRTY